DNSQGVYPLEREEKEYRSPERAIDYSCASVAQPTQIGLNRIKIQNDCSGYQVHGYLHVFQPLNR
ncbi:MAG: hypothetical protein NTV79_05385, partial [Candidatus Aureabacteria bacterium]|nr:hypothetical protein [Candidatus Auribacterota bacterium]